MLKVLQGDVRTRKRGAQPRSSRVDLIVRQRDSAKLYHCFRGKRKLIHAECVQSPILAEPVGAASDLVKTPLSEEGEVGGLHYFLRMPKQQLLADMPSGAQPSGQPAPLLLFLHGSGERGKEDGTELHKVKKHGPWHCEGADPFWILAPQCPQNRIFPTLVNEVLLVLTDVCKRHLVDKSRIYITGLSMGAFGAWSLAVSQPHMFAAVVSICGGFVGRLSEKDAQMSRAQMLRLSQIDRDANGKRWNALKKCKKMPAWIFHGRKDKIVLPECSDFLFNALGGIGNENVRRTTYHDVGHSCWGKAYNTLHLYTWLLKHSQAPCRSWRAA